MRPPVVVVSGAATDAGQRRTLNEDAYLAEAPLFLVADGMGGHEAGDTAAATVVEEFAALGGRGSLTPEDVRETLARARRRVDGLSQTCPSGAGTTLSGVVVTEVDGSGYWLAVNIGDSRTYRLGTDGLEQISVDHSVVQELVDGGVLAPEDAGSDPRRNVITRAIGAGSDADADFWMLPAAQGDRILICSDGLPAEVDAAWIAAVLRAEPHPQEAAARLVTEAVRRGGRDNVTVVVVDAVAVARRGSASGVPTAEIEIESDTRPRQPAEVNER